jgi:hypothetical protein
MSPSLWPCLKAQGAVSIEPSTQIELQASLRNDISERALARSAQFGQFGAAHRRHGRPCAPPHGAQGNTAQEADRSDELTRANGSVGPTDHSVTMRVW